MGSSLLLLPHHAPLGLSLASSLCQGCAASAALSLSACAQAERKLQIAPHSTCDPAPLWIPATAEV